MQDSEIIDRILKNDSTAFEQLVRKYKNLVYTTCHRILKNQVDADDIFQDVFMEVFRSLSHLKNYDDMSGWIFRISYSKCINHHRKKNPARADTVPDHEENPRLGDSGMDVETPLHSLEKKEASTLLFKHIDQLPDNQKRALLLHKFEGYSYKEICEEMNLTQASVESLIYRAKSSLRKSLLNYFVKE